MKITITFDVDLAEIDSDNLDADDRTGLSAEGFDLVHDFLADNLGAEDIEIRAS